MSELTRCNYCTLRRMRERRQDMWGRPIEVIVTPSDPKADGWISARYADREEPSVFFLDLSDHCVC